MPGSTKKAFLNIGLFGAIVVCDQLTKFAVVENLRHYEVIQVLPFFNLVRLHNSGISFGMLNKLGNPLLLIMISVAVIWLLISYGRKNQKFLPMVTMVMAGAIGNIIDRIRYGYVVDFLDFYIGSYHWPAFNVADSAIVIGTLLLMWFSYKEDKIQSLKTARKEENA